MLERTSRSRRRPLECRPKGPGLTRGRQCRLPRRSRPGRSSSPKASRNRLRQWPANPSRASSFLIPTTGELAPEPYSSTRWPIVIGCQPLSTIDLDRVGHGRRTRPSARNFGAVLDLFSFAGDACRFFERKRLHRFICFDARIGCPGRIARAIASDRQSRQHRALLRCLVLRAMLASAVTGHHWQFS